MAAKRRDDNWVDGLRGVASFIVLTGHLCAAFAEYLHDPSKEENGKILFFQLPIIRLIVGGRAAVALFFMITGYVNSINPLKNINNGALETAFSNLAKSAFMRTWRLVLPTATAILFGWIMFELGMFRMAKLCDSFWISYWIRNPEKNLGSGIWRLIRAEIEYWMTGTAVYNATLWTVPFFLHGSMMVYLTLLATAYVKPTFRRLIIIGLWLMGWCGRSPIEHINIFFGLFMADVHTSLSSSSLLSAASSPNLLPSSPILGSDSPLLSRSPTRQSIIRKLSYPIPALTIFVGLLACCFPETNPRWATWSRHMDDMMLPLIPRDIDVNRYWMSVGASLVFVGIHFCPTAQRILTSPVFNFLGRCSFPVYLMHDQLMRTVLVWMIYGGSEVTKDNEGKIQTLKRGGPGTFAIAIPIFYACVYLVAWLWMNHLDPQFARITLWMKNKAWREPGTKSAPKPPAWAAEKGANLV